MRMDTVKKLEGNVEEIFKTYKILSSIDGAQLIQADFKRLRIKFTEPTNESWVKMMDLFLNIFSPSSSDREAVQLMALGDDNELDTGVFFKK